MPWGWSFRLAGPEKEVEWDGDVGPSATAEILALSVGGFPGYSNNGKIGNFCKILAGSFSAVLKRNFARKYAFGSTFQDLQNLHTFAPGPLQSQNFSKKSV